jgi:hypothetical protein
MKILMPSLSTLALLALSAGFIQAQTTTSIVVPNFSFEDPAGGNVHATIDVPGFTFVNADGYQGTQAPGTFTTGSIDGLLVGFMNITQPSESTITTGTLTSINAGDTYQATVEVGNAVGTGLFDDPGNVFLNILANGTVVATTALPIGTIPEGTIQDYSVSLTGAQTLALGGQALSFQMEALDPTAQGFDTSNPLTDYTPEFDNIRVTDTSAIPEPSTYAMMLGGLALLGFYFRRKLA